MAKKVQRRSLDASTMATTIAPARETVIDDTNWVPVLHDGITPGGIPIARADLANVADASNSNDGKMTKEQVAQQESNTARGFGVLDKAITGNVALTAVETENFGFTITGTIGADATITLPDEVRYLLLENKTTGGFNLVIKTATGTGTITVPNGSQYFLKVNDAFDVTKLAEASESVQKAGDTMTGDLTIDKVTPKIRLETDGATDAIVEFFDGTVLRGALIWDESNESVTLISRDAAGAVVNIVDVTATANVIHVNGNVVWHAGNDGSGSGLDADLLDGFSAAQAATENTVAVRGAGGVLAVADPVAAVDAVTKNYLETAIAASKAEMEAGTATSKYVTPENIINSRSAIKAWGNVSSGGTLQDSENVSSIDLVSNGNLRVNLSITMADANYAVVLGLEMAGSINVNPNLVMHTPTTTSFRLFWTDNPNRVGVHFAVLGKIADP